ncbi:Retrovirus-related Pol polyprotein from transposon RE1 [Glycine soja]|uniref:Retrovirus-related Pol polyprotein from transposon RE1 n=1 Tax=Glycine soja TaxID=3848 RepID=A0A445GCD0_GLYSO|nr:Retrovirus-related Pol polyprotein from transposon RE1 [Glycine soja]
MDQKIPIVSTKTLIQDLFSFKNPCCRLQPLAAAIYSGNTGFGPPLSARQNPSGYGFYLTPTGSHAAFVHRLDLTSSLQGQSKVFFLETHFFSSSKQDINSIQKVLLIPSFNPVVFPIRENSNQEQNHSRPPTNRAVKLSSPPPLISQHRTQGIDPTLHGESSSSCYSPLASPMTDPSSSLLHHHLLMMMTQALEHSDTWELVPLLPGKKVVGCRWVYAIKVGPNGEVDRLKAQLVAKGYTQIYGLDYGDTFSPVAKITTILLFFAMAAIVIGPYFHSIEGIVVSQRKYALCILEEIGMTNSRPIDSPMDPNQKLMANQETSLPSSRIRALLSRLTCVVRHAAVACVVHWSSVSRVHRLLVCCRRARERRLLLSCASPAPAPPFVALETAAGRAAEEEKLGHGYGGRHSAAISNPQHHRYLVAFFQISATPFHHGRFLITLTRPNISFAISVASQFMQAPHVDHWKAMIRILRYIKKAPRQGLLYENKGNTQIFGFCEADWARDAP